MTISTIPDDESRILEAMGPIFEKKGLAAKFHLESLSAATGCPVSRIVEILSRLELVAAQGNDLGGEYIRITSTLYFN